MTRKKDEVTRAIRFYSIEFKLEGVEANPVEIFNEINTLQYPDRYRLLADGRSRSLDLYGQFSKDLIRAIMGTKRIEGLPQVEDNGKKRPLKLTGNEGLYEPTHFSIFSGKVLAMEHNQYGPKSAALTDYLIQKAPEKVDEINVLPIPRKDLTETLDKIGMVKLFEVEVLPDQSKHLNNLDKNLASGLKEMKKFTGVRTFGLILKAEDNSRKQKPFKGIFSNLRKNKDNKELWDSMETLKVTAINKSTKKVDLFDLMENLVKSKKDVKKDDNGSRSVNSASMFNALSDSYQENAEDILKFIKLD